MEALKEEFSLPIDPAVSEGSTATEQAESLKRVKKNDLAVACLTMSFTTDEDMEYIEESATSYYPDGIAMKITAAMKKNYRPVDRLAAVETETEM